eukprot:CAMPEP_0170606210 /NCGR_PEP_ID=MMETSP0224-20130122/20386_1 /TAXON_ID=285029 /ORGANISM="Togula jolla, Strain CCCM 725" /LENGTH=377 /DNA_ID=CAMNT_0010931267 /DNA_START=120 /DNA_END=1253 /DNA_ORIENTATION=-
MAAAHGLLQSSESIESTHKVDSTLFVDGQISAWDRAEKHALQQIDMCIEKHTDSPWKSLIQKEDAGKKNLCSSEGKLLPELYLVGEPKSATTSLALDLMSVGIGTLGIDFRTKHPHRHRHCSKELHFFDVALNQANQAADEKQRWLKLLPNCSSRRQVLADFTPNYLASVPAPENFQLRPKMRRAVNVPETLHDWYGEQGRNITFLTLLRNPLGRLHSVWHGCGMSKRSRFEKFQDAIQSLVATAGATGKADSLLYSISYAKHLKVWLEHFSAAQFVIVPFGFYTKGEKDRLCLELSRRMSFDIDCDSKGHQPSHHFASGPQTLEKETTAEFRKDFDNFTRADVEELASLLLQAHSKGAFLAGYNGGDVLQWLRSNW